MPTEIGWLGQIAQGIVNNDRSQIVRHREGFDYNAFFNSYGRMDLFESSNADRPYPLRGKAADDIREGMRTGKIRVQQIPDYKIISGAQTPYTIKYTGTIILSSTEIPKEEVQDVVVLTVVHGSERNVLARQHEGRDIFEDLFLVEMIYQKQPLSLTVPFSTKADTNEALIPY